MSRIRDLRRQLEAEWEAVERLDADRAAGRLAEDEHRRQRAEREAEIGRLFVTLRRAQRETRQRPPEPAATPAAGPAWFRRPIVIVPAAVLLLVAGVGAGVGLGRWLTGPPAAPLASAPPATPGAGPATGGFPGALGGIELQLLRQEAAREDAPLASLLQLGHVGLDQGRPDEARPLYERVLRRDPRNVEAITHLGAVAHQEGRLDEALARVEEALRIDPRYIHALWDRTQYLFQGKRDFAAAVKAAEAFLAVVPQGPDADTVRKLMEDARRQAVSGKGR